MSCLDDTTIALYVDGRLAREEALRAELHLDTCVVCRELCAEVARDGVGDASASSTDLFGPDTVFERYQIIRLLGSGGMGEVYLARDTRLGRKVALKLIHPKRIGSSDAQRMFLEEARSTARFNHPNIVTLYDAGEFGGRLFLALEYLEGESLRQRMKRDRIGVLEAVRIMRAIAEALREAHAAGVLHRDLKPGNVLIPKDGRVRIIDFGLARDTFRSDLPPAIVGTPHYMSPEARRGEPIGTRADMYSFGLLLSELVKHEPALPEELRALIDRCLSNEAAVRPSAADACEALEALLFAKRRLDPEASPYRGLAAFREEDADLFFGRDAEILIALELLRDSAALAVVGPSGAGKSSLVHAGIVARLRESARWIVLSMRPGHDPIALLAARLGADASTIVSSPERVALHLAELGARTKSKVLLVVDQLEELYTMVESEETRRIFLRALAAAGDDRESGTRVIVTLRDDFFGQLAGADARRLLSCTFAVKSPNQASLAEAVIAPLTSVGHRFEDEGLSAEMVEEVRDAPLALPLLEFAASMLWERRDREAKIIRRDAYVAMGGVAGALAQHADGVLASLGKGELELARRILVRLIGPENTRRVLRAEEVLAGLGEKAQVVLQSFITARLIVVRRAREQESDAAELELVHESLIRSWHTLRRWIAESKGDRPVLEEALEAAKLWERRGRSVDEVWRGAALVDAERALARTPFDAAPPIVREFLALGMRRERRRVFEKRALAAVVVAASLVFVVAMYRQKESAVSAAAHVLRESAASALANGRFLEARAKLRSSIEVEDSVEARMLWLDLERSPILWKLDFDTVIRAFAFSPDEKTIAVTVVDNTVRLIDVDTAAMKMLGAYEEQIFAIAFSPDGKRLASGTQAGRVGVWNLASARYRELGAHDGPVLDLAWDPSAEDRFVTTSADGTVRAFHGGESELLYKRSFTRIAFSPDGAVLAGIVKNELATYADVLVSAIEAPEDFTALAVAKTRIVAGHPSGALSAFDLSANYAEPIESQHRAQIRRLAIDPRGEHVLTGSEDQTIRLDGELLDTFHEPVTGVALFRNGSRAVASTYHQVAVYAPVLTPHATPAVGHNRPSISVSFTADGKTLASSSTDRTLKLWDVASGGELATLIGHEGPVHESSISPDGTIVASPSNDRTVRLWNVATGKERARLSGHGGSVYAVAFNPSGDRVASVGAEGTVIIWDVARELRVTSFPAFAVSGSLEYDRSGRSIAVAGDDGLVRGFDAETGALRFAYTVHRAPSAFVAHSHDGEWIASAGEDGMVRRVRVKDGLVEDVARTGGRAWSAAWYPGDRRIAISASTGAWIKTLDGEMIPLLGHRGEVNAISLSPDATLLATAGDDGTVRLWRASDGTPVWRGKEQGARGGELPASLEGVPSSPVQQIRTMHGGLLAAGFASGHVGLWNPSTGARLRLEKLHGAIAELTVSGTSLSIGSELGVSTTWDLSALSSDRCALLSAIWRKVPVVWENGRAVEHAPGRCTE